MTGPPVRETLHFLDSPHGPRFAIVSHPTVSPSGVGVLMCNGGWYPGSWNFNRLYVHLARSLADQGHRVVRFDWYGSGESPGYLPHFRLSDPFAEDVVRASSLLEDCEIIVGAGICFGATSLLAAGQLIEKLSGLVLVSVAIPGSGPRSRATKATVRSVMRSSMRPSIVMGWFDPYARRLYLKWLRLRWQAITRQARPRNSTPDRSSVASQIQNLATKGRSVWFLYGDGDGNLSAFTFEPLASVSSLETVRIETVPFDVEGSGTIEAQDATAEVIAEMVVAVSRAHRR